MNKLLLTSELLLIIILSNSTMFVQNINFSLANQTSDNIVSSTYIPVTNTKSLPRIALVKPVFTATAYDSFYSYFADPNLSTSYLTAPIINTWGTSSFGESLSGLLVTHGYPQNKIYIISDIILHFNQLYNSNGYRLYDTLVFFHNEYVSGPEYNNMLQFIAAGGNVVFLNGNPFFAEVLFNSSTNSLSLIRGHYYEYDGTYTRSNPFYRYYGYFSNNENKKYIGSEVCTYNSGSFTKGMIQEDKNNPSPFFLEMQQKRLGEINTSFYSHEENCLLTKNARVLIDWKSDFKTKFEGIKTYEIFPMGPFGGSLVHFGVSVSNVIKFSSTIIEAIIAVFYHQSGYSASPWIRYPVKNGVYNDPNLVIDFTPYWPHDVYLNDTFLGPLRPKTGLGYLSEGTYNLTISFHLLNQIITRTIFFSIDRTPPVIYSPVNNSTLLDYPTVSLPITIQDKHPEEFSYFIYSNELLQSNTSKVISGINHILEDEPTLERNVSLNLPNGTSFISIKAFDSAGNMNESIYGFNVNNSNNFNFHAFQPTLYPINNTAVNIAVPGFGSKITPFLLINDAFKITKNSENWYKVNFTNYDTNTNIYHFIITKKAFSNILLYKLFIANGSYSLNLPFMESYYWNNNIVSIRTTASLNPVTGSEPFQLNILNYFKHTINISITISNYFYPDNNSILSNLNMYETNIGTAIPINDLNPGYYVITVTIFSSVTFRLTIPIIIQKSINTGKTLTSNYTIPIPIPNTSQTSIYNFNIENLPNYPFYFIFQNCSFNSFSWNEKTQLLAINHSGIFTIRIITYDPSHESFVEQVFSFVRKSDSTITTQSETATSSITFIAIVFALPFALYFKKKKNE